MPAAVAVLCLAVLPPAVAAHCQIPCGIYDDPMRISLMMEHVTTIEKSMNEIEHLSGESDINWNQLVRWVMNKEDHAEELSQIATFYFMAQRVKPVETGETGADKYMEQLRLLHMIQVEAMRAKQTVDVEHCDNLRDLISRFESSYFEK